MIVGLTRNSESLVDIRRNRLTMLHAKAETDYVDPDKVHNEVLEARRFFTRIACPVIDVSRRSIEETAAEIIMLLDQRRIEREEKNNGNLT